MSEHRSKYWDKFEELGVERVHQELAVGTYGEGRKRAAREWLDHKKSSEESEARGEMISEARTANDVAREANELAHSANSWARSANKLASDANRLSDRALSRATINTVVAAIAALTAIVALVISMVSK